MRLSLPFAFSLIVCVALCVACSSEESKDPSDTAPPQDSAGDTSTAPDTRDDTSTEPDIADTSASDTDMATDADGQDIADSADATAADITADVTADITADTVDDAPSTDASSTDASNTDATDVADTTGPAAGECRDGNDCSGMESCYSPSDENCGMCQSYPTCGDDSNCNMTIGEVCSGGLAISCLCDPGPVCSQGCAADSDCKPGFACQGARCEPITCSGDGDCPANFGCDAGSCARVSCSTDADCPGSHPCVEGFCYDTYGTCSMPVP